MAWGSARRGLCDRRVTSPGAAGLVGAERLPTLLEPFARSRSAGLRILERRQVAAVVQDEQTRGRHATRDFLSALHARELIVAAPQEQRRSPEPVERAPPVVAGDHRVVLTNEPLRTRPVRHAAKRRRRLGAAWPVRVDGERAQLVDDGLELPAAHPLVHPPSAFGFAAFVERYFSTDGFLMGYTLASRGDLWRLLYVHVVAPLLVMGVPVLLMGASFPFLQAVVARGTNPLSLACHRLPSVQAALASSYRPPRAGA